MWRKSCPRCCGDLFLEHLPGGDEVTCLQCGYNLRDSEVAGLRASEQRHSVVGRIRSREIHASSVA